MACLIEWIQDYAIVVQALATVVLVGVTIVYALLTNRTAKAADRSAEATRKLAESTEDMKIAAVQPVVVADARPSALGSRLRDLGVFLVNVGLGPALDVFFKFKSSKVSTLEGLDAANGENKGHTIGAGRENALEVGGDKLTVLATTRLRDGGLVFVAQYDDIHGHHYQTTTCAGRTTTEPISERDPSLQPARDTEEQAGV